MAVERRLARLNDPDELRDVEAARVFVDQIAERPLNGGSVLRLVVETDRSLSSFVVDRKVCRCGDGDHKQLVGARVVDRVALARCNEGGGAGLERMTLAFELELAPAVNHVEQLVARNGSAVARPTGRKADDTL